MLHYISIASRDARAWILAVHGIFGRGANLRTLARHISQRRPDWGLLLVDLREHGLSQGSLGPHTIATAAADVAELARYLCAEGGAPVAALMGHSLGGKVVTRAAEQLGTDLRQLWVLDSSPSARPKAFSPPRHVPKVLSMLEELVPIAISRDDFVARVIERGFDRAIASWLAMNYQRDGAGWRFALNLAAMRSLLESYYDDDVWSLYDKRHISAEIHVVVAERSSSIQSSELDRFEVLAPGTNGLEVHGIDTGHWLHAERPEELAELVARHLPQCDW